MSSVLYFICNILSDEIELLTFKGDIGPGCFMRAKIKSSIDMIAMMVRILDRQQRCSEGKTP